MNFRIISLFAFSILLYFAVHSSSFSQKTNLELGARYIKLGNTYTKSRLFDSAFYFINKGKKIAEKEKSLYWQAAALEYLAYLNMEQGKIDVAKKYLSESIDIYKKIIKQKDGSPAAVQALLRMKGYFADAAGKIALKGSDEIQDEFNYSYLKVYKDIKEAEANPEKVYILDLSGQNASELLANTDIKKFKNLVSLNLSDSRLSDLPDGLTKLENLYHLDLSMNRLSDIPDDVFNLKHLTHLNLSENQVGELPEEICKMQNLVEIKLASNRLSELPDCVGKMTNIEMLNIADNKFSLQSIVNIARNLPKQTQLIVE